jgi:hypothetical protein
MMAGVTTFKTRTKTITWFHQIWAKETTATNITVQKIHRATIMDGDLAGDDLNKFYIGKTVIIFFSF